MKQFGNLFPTVDALRRSARSSSSQQSSPVTTPRAIRIGVNSPPPFSPGGSSVSGHGDQPERPPLLVRRTSEPLPGDDPMVLKVLSRPELLLLMVPLDDKARLMLAGKRQSQPGVATSAAAEEAGWNSRAVMDTLRLLVRGLRDPRGTLDRQSCIVPAPIPLVFEGIRTLLGLRRSDANLCSALYRSLRYLVRDQATAEALHRTRLHLFLLRSLERDPSEGGAAVMWERLEALKLYRRLLQVKGFKPSVSLAMSLVAVSTHKQESDSDACFRRLCMETLREVAATDPATVARANGFKALVEAVMDTNLQDLSEPILLTLLHLITDPSTRAYLKPFLDLQVLLSPLTNLDLTDVTERASKLEASRRALAIMLRTWAGVMLLSSDERKGLMAVLHLLSDASVDEVVRVAVFDVLEEVLQPLVSSTLRSPSRLPAEYRSSVAGAEVEWVPAWEEDECGGSGPGAGGRAGGATGLPEVHNLLDSFLAFLLSALIKCRLLECLTALALSDCEDVSGRATCLLTDISRVMPRLLPQAQCVSLMSMPALVTMCDSKSAAGRASRLLALRASDLITRLGGGQEQRDPGCTREESQGRADVAAGEGSGWGEDPSFATMLAVMREVGRVCHPSEAQGSLQSGELASEQLLSDLRPYLDSVTDKAVLEAKLGRTKVLLGKDPSKWDWDMILSTAEDTLVSSARLLDVIKGRLTFVRRLCDSFKLSQPDRGFFPDLPWEPANLRFLLVACQLYHSLASHQDGLMLLQTEPRARTFHELSQLLQATMNDLGGGGPGLGSAVSSAMGGGGGTVGPLLDSRCLSTTMTRGYFTLLGLLSQSENGVELLRSTGLLMQLFPLANRPELDFISRAVLVNLNYTGVSSFSRELLQVWSSAGSAQLRVFAINVIKTQLYCKVPDFETWGIDMLVTQLHFDDAEVVGCAIRVLEEAAHDPEYLRAIIAKRPELLHRDAESRTLRLLLLSTENGLEYLEQTGWLEHSFKHEWGLPPLSTTPQQEPAGDAVLSPSSSPCLTPLSGVGPNKAEPVGRGTPGSSSSSNSQKLQGWEVAEYVTRTERRLTRTMHAMSTGGTQGAAAVFSDGFLESEWPAALPAAPPILPPSMASSSFTSACEDAPSKPAAPQPPARPCPIVIKCGDLTGSHIPMHDLRSLLSLPWNIQVQLCSGGDANGDVVGGGGGDLLAVDTVVDLTTFRPLQRYAEDSDELLGHTFFTVKALLLDPQTGRPCPQVVGSEQSLRAVLRVGNCFVDRQGNLLPDHKFHTTPRLRSPSDSFHPSRQSASMGDLAAFGDDLHDFVEPMTPVTPATGTDAWEDSQVDWSVCRARSRAEAEEAAMEGRQVAGGPGQADGGRASRSTSNAAIEALRSSPQPPSSPRVNNTGSPQPGNRSSGRFAPIAGSSSGNNSPAQSAGWSSKQPGNAAAGVGGGGLVYHVVSREEPARWTFQRVPQRRPPSRASAVTTQPGVVGAGGPREVPALCSVEFLVLLDYQNRYSSPLPIHAYGELVRTERGCRFLETSGMLAALLARCQWGAVLDRVPCTGRERRAVLWALGHVCSTERGLAMVLRASPSVITWVVHLGESHDNLSYRATCFCILGLVARSQAGRAELKKAGWEVGGGVVRGVSSSMPIAVPKDMAVMLRLPDDAPGSSVIAHARRVEHDEADDDDLMGSQHHGCLASTSSSSSADMGAGGGQRSPSHLQHAEGGAVLSGGSGRVLTMEEEVFGLVVKLSNYVTRKEAQVQLARLRRKSRYRRKFRSLRFYLRVLDLMSRYSFKLPMRRFVSELFNDVDMSPEAWTELSHRQLAVSEMLAAEEEDEDEDEEGAAGDHQATSSQHRD